MLSYLKCKNVKKLSSYILLYQISPVFDGAENKGFDTPCFLHG